MDGESLGFVEVQGEVEVYRLENDWKLVSKHKGSFDDFDWASSLPAQVFISPGVDPRRSFFKKIKKHEIREVDYFAEHFSGPIVAVTGTDGKSTFVTRLGEILRRALPNKKIFIGGNLGIAMCDGLKNNPYEAAVIEVSSFQAERLKSANIGMAILLNLSTDHMDRYDSVFDYHKAKWELLNRGKLCVYPEGLAAPGTIAPSEVTFTSNEDSLSLLKKVTARLSKILSFDLKEEFFEDLPSLPHRLEKIERSDHRTFVNDSKATTVHAVRYGIAALRKEFSTLKIILGGRSKGDNFSKLEDILDPNDTLYVYGEAAERILEQLKAFPGEMKAYASLAQLLDSEIKNVGKTECLLLSPGCASFGEFKNFEERGEFFLKKVQDQAIL